MTDAIVFSCFTSYQLLNAIYYGMMLKNNKSFNKMLVWNNRTSQNINLDFITSYFDKIIDISGFDICNCLIKVKKQAIYEGRLFFISPVAKELKNYNKIRLVCFSDQLFIDNRLIDYVAKHYISEIVLIEEGLGTYLLNTNKKFNLIKRIYYKVLGIKTEKHIGANSNIKTIIVKHPEKLPDCKAKGRLIIQQNNIFADKKWVVEFNELIGGIESKIKIPKESRIILWIGQPLEEQGVSESSVLQFLLDLSKRFGDSYTILIKCHPREAEAKYDSILCERIKKIDMGSLSWLPLELLAGFLKPQIVLSAFSSAALNLLELGLDTEVYFCYKLFNLDIDSNFFEIKDNARVKNISSIDEIFITEDKVDFKVRKETNENFDLEYLNMFFNSD